MSRNSNALSESEPTLRLITEYVRRLGFEPAPGEIGFVRGLYLYGSAVSPAGLKPHSDLDLLLVTSRSLRSEQRLGLVRMLLGVSGWSGHADTYPEVAHRRPVELTSVVAHERTPRTDFQYGEWLRAELVGAVAGPDAFGVSESDESADVVILLANALSANRALLGSRLDSLVGPVSTEMLGEAIVSTVPEVLENLPGDERNAILTLARMLVTLESGEIVSKDDAATIVAPNLPQPWQRLLVRARADYLGLNDDEAGGLTETFADLAELARELASRIHGVARR